MSNSQVIKINAQEQETAEALVTVGHVKKYPSFIAFLHSADCPRGVPVTDVVDTIKAKPMPSSLELFSELQRTKAVCDSKEKEAAEIVEKIKKTEQECQTISGRLMRCKDDKNSVLTSLNALGVLESPEEQKKLTEVNALIESLEFSLRSNQQKLAQLSKGRISNDELARTRNNITFAEKAFLKAIAVEIKSYLFEGREMRWLWAIYTKTTSKTFLRDILKDCFPASGITLEYDPKELEATIKDIFDFYESSFEKEGK